LALNNSILISQAFNIDDKLADIVKKETNKKEKYTKFYR
jgi:hypothetical protein